MSLFFQDKGTGPALVFLHGFCDTHELWEDFVKPLTSKYRVVTPDLPGFGKSEILQEPFSIEQVGEIVSAWLRESGIQNPILVGHSLGGYVALSLVDKHPNQLSGICLFHSTPFADSEERRQIRNKVITSVEKNGVSPFIKAFVPGLFVDQTNSGIASMYARAQLTKSAALIGYSKAMRDRPDLSGMLQQSGIPKLVITGADDSLIKADTLRKWAHSNVQCTFRELENVAHMGIFEAKTECQSIISKFAREVFLSNRFNFQ